MKYLISILLLISVKLLSQTDNFNYSENFFKYDYLKKSYIPYINNPIATNCLSFLLKYEDSAKDIIIFNSHEYTIFVNSKLYLCARGNETTIIKSAELLNSARNNTLITIYTTQNLKNLKVNSLKNKTPSTEITFTDITYIKKNIENRYILGLVIVIMALIILKSSIPSIAKDVFGLVKSNFNERGTLFKKQGVPIVILILVMFFLMIFMFTPSLNGTILKYNAHNTYILSTLIIYFILLFTLKAIMHTVFGYLYKIPKVSYSYTIELLLISIFIIFIFAPLYLFVFTPYYTVVSLNASFFGYAAWIVFLGLTINELYFFYSRQQGQTIYIFSYICICDIIPFIVSYKFVKDFQIA